MKHWPLGAKLTAWCALVVGLVVLVGGIAAGLFIQQEQIEALDDQLASEAHTFFGEVGRRGTTLDWTQEADVKAILPLTRTERFVEVAKTNGRILYRSRSLHDRDLRDLPLGMQKIKIGRDQVRIGVFQEGSLTLYLAAELDEIYTDNEELAIGFVFSLPLVVIVSAIGGWWLAGKALAPIREITDAAEQITAERLDRRLPHPKVRDEIGRLTDVLNAMFDRLDVSFRQAARFSADASHELKTPLTILRSSIEDLLTSTTLSDADRIAIFALLEQTRRLSGITEDLLLLSRADAGRLDLDFAPHDVVALVSGCADDAGIMAESQRISIETEMPKRLLASIDARRFERVIFNLLDNAVKYNRAEGRVKVGVAVATGNLAVTVANTGAGIPQAHAAQLFERFFRSDPQPNTAGHGLGLNLAREFTRAHGGDLRLVQSDSEWTVFAVEIPFKEPIPEAGA